MNFCMDFVMVMHVLLFKNTKGVFPIEWPLASAYRECMCGELYMREICILTIIKEYNIWNQATMLSVWICATG